MKFEATQKYIAKMLSDESKFIIPPYQRPYKWGINECETLWNDIVNAFMEEDDEYFLGSILAYSERKGDFQIIDGQQRITTFSLLFRAFYEHFQDEPNKEDFPKEFGKCLWAYENGVGFDFDEHH